MILLSEKTTNPKKNGQALIGGLPIRTTRNYFGSQIASFETMLDIKPLSSPFPAIFIRAPVVEEIYQQLGADDTATEKDSDTKGKEDKVEVCSKLEVHSEVGQQDLIVAVRKGNIFGTAFHPELTKDNRLHEWWIKEVVLPSWSKKEENTKQGS